MNGNNPANAQLTNPTITQDDSRSQDYSMQKSKNNTDFRLSMLTETVDDLITRFENGEIMREQLKEAIVKKKETLKDISNLKSERM